MKQTFTKSSDSGVYDYDERITRTLALIRNKLSKDTQLILSKNTSISWIPHRFSRKGNSFSHENELRMFVEGRDSSMKCVASEDGKSWAWEIVPREKIIPIDGNDNGIYVNVNFNDFIEKVYVSPFSEKWFLNLVKALTEKYELNPSIVEKSDLYDSPSI